MQTAQNHPFKLPLTIAGGVVALLFGWWLVASALETCENGNRCMYVRFGKVLDTPIEPGLAVMNPFTTDLVQMNIQIIKWEGTTQAYTKDVQQATIKFTLNFGLDQSAVADTYRTVGHNWSQKLVAHVVYEDIKREVGQHEAVNLVSQRDIAARAIESSVRKMLAARNVLVTGFQLTNIDYTREFEQAVEKKVVAQQQAIEEQNRTVQKEELAKQQIVAAKGNAEATITNAKAEAESIRIRAQALEQNAKLVEWEAVQKWNGQMPTYMMGNSVPFINLAGK